MARSMPTFECGSAGRGSLTAHVDARDVAAVAARCLPEGGHDGQAYTPTGPAALTYDECAAILSEVRGHPIGSTDPTPWPTGTVGDASGDDRRHARHRSD